jgi:hypothetical protein
MKIVIWTLTITVRTRTTIFLLGSSLLLSAQSECIAQFLNGMPNWSSMTPEDINLAVESIPNPSEGHILPGLSLQEAIEVNVWHHIHDRHYEIITLISYVHTILYTYIVYDIVIDGDDIVHDIVFDSLPDV